MRLGDEGAAAAAIMADDVDVGGAGKVDADDDGGFDVVFDVDNIGTPVREENPAIEVNGCAI